MSNQIDQLLVRASAMLRESETATPELDAEVLLAHVLGQTRSWLLAHGQQTLKEEDCRQFFRHVEARAQGEPVAYLVGEREFWSLPLRVTPDVLIPRPETELLVEQGLACLEPGVRRVLELGTGSGAIALALAKERPDLEITAVDRSEQCLAVARDNAKRLNLISIRFLLSNWYDAVAGETFDLVLGNPPYVAPNDEHLSGELRFEPAEALVSDENGLADLRVIIASAPSVLLPGGYLMLEHGFDQSDAVKQYFEETGFYEVESIPDLAGLPRIVCGRLSGIT